MLEPTSARWHAPHPAQPRQPLCGTVSLSGAPTHRIARHLAVTCKRCLKLQAKQEPATTEGATCPAP